MKLLVDTFSWKKLDILDEKKLLDLSDLYENHEIYVTHEVLSEVKHFGYTSFNESQTRIIPIKNRRIYQDAIDLHFDKADASILSNGTRDEEIIIITEDRPLLQLAKGYNFTIIQLADLISILNALDEIERNQSFKIVKELFELRNISEKKFKSIKRILYEK